MLIPCPIRFHDSRPMQAVPVVNGLLIVANVLIFWIGWSPALVVGPGTGVFSPLTYAFAHANVWHLAGNMLFLMVFGTPVNARLGNGWYLATYLGSALFLGIAARFLCPGELLGASGAIFAVMTVALLLMPAAVIDIAYFALFPMTLLVGLFHKPPHIAFWFIRWDVVKIRAWWGLLVVPLLELWGLLVTGWNWTNLGHLLGLACGVAAVLLLPEQITMGRRARAFAGG